MDAPQTPAEVEELRACVNRQQPYGTKSWMMLPVSAEDSGARRQGAAHEPENNECPHFPEIRSVPYLHAGRRRHRCRRRPGRALANAATFSILRSQ